MPARDQQLTLKTVLGVSDGSEGDARRTLKKQTNGLIHGFRPLHYYWTSPERAKVVGIDSGRCRDINQHAAPTQFDKRLTVRLSNT